MWLIRVLLPILALGILVPFYKGYDFADAGLLVFYACSPFLLSPAGDFARRDLLRAAAASALIPLISIPLGLAVASYKLGYPVTPGYLFLAALATLSIASAIFGVALKSKITRASGDPARARRVVLVVMGGVLVLQLLGVPMIPPAFSSPDALTYLITVIAVSMVAISFVLVRR